MLRCAAQMNQPGSACCKKGSILTHLLVPQYAKLLFECVLLAGFDAGCFHCCRVLQPRFHQWHCARSLQHSAAHSFEAFVHLLHSFEDCLMAIDVVSSTYATWTSRSLVPVRNLECRCFTLGSLCLDVQAWFWNSKPGPGLGIPSLGVPSFLAVLEGICCTTCVSIAMSTLHGLCKVQRLTAGGHMEN